ncbi:hypothetical protein [Gemmatimonas sp.]|uniref:hypothetical protein n=1 Tax=Gemmatimonas sp. TaxID=1962908 RepID=UPI0022C4F61E|nr:hypothetical protein [Gemmatimonas sp.]MCZ8206498.1 hypothetical protein [Gemmatimonas sp.]
MTAPRAFSAPSARWLGVTRRAASVATLTVLAARPLLGGDPPVKSGARGPGSASPVPAAVSDNQSVLDNAVVGRFPSAMLLFDVGVEAALSLSMLSAPIVSFGSAPTPTAPYVVAMHDAPQPALPPLAVGDRVAFVGGKDRVPSRIVRGVVVARRHYMFTRTRVRRTQADGAWEYGWAYLVQVPLRDRNPNSRFQGWLQGFSVTRDPGAAAPE